ncbi:MAG: hypothetical protein Q8P49_02915 [Candidatus Liptonbacteria bacterium]|nr:hypothetical protein [Candidatus Liptonbacteria bacterium]
MALLEGSGTALVLVTFEIHERTFASCVHAAAKNFAVENRDLVGLFRQIDEHMKSLKGNSSSEIVAVSIEQIDPATGKTIGVLRPAERICA